MAYYNGFPATYQPYYAPPAPVQVQPQANQQVQQNTGLIWVQGEQAAKSYLVAPGSTVQLWDSEERGARDLPEKRGRERDAFHENPGLYDPGRGTEEGTDGVRDQKRTGRAGGKDQRTEKRTGGEEKADESDQGG